MSRFRGYCFTSFNEIEPIFNDQKMKYLIYGKEIAPTTNKEHWQGYVYFHTLTSLKSIHKLEGFKGVHVEVVRGTSDENIKYCSKDGKYKEFGERPKQGKRTDLEKLKEELIKGKKDMDEVIIELSVDENMKYYKALERIRDIHYQKNIKKEMTEGIWLFGETGTGKSHMAFNNFDHKTHYVYEDDNGWWDNYKQQNNVIINDFRGDTMKYNQLLQLCDKWPVSVKRRCRSPIPFTSNKIIITSSLPPEKIFKERNRNDNIAQLYRRFKVYEVKNDVVMMHRNIEGIIDQMYSTGNTMP